MNERIVENPNQVISGFGNKIKSIGEQFNTIKSEKLDKNGIVTMANMGQDVKEAMTGGSVAVVGVHTISSENIIRNQIEPEHTMFLTKSENLFDYKKMVEGYSLSSGNPVVNSSMMYCSQYIPVKPNTDYYITVLPSNILFSYYDYTKKFISEQGTGGNGVKITTPSNCYYIRFFTFKSINYLMRSFQINEGKLKEYDDYKSYIIDSNNIIGLTTHNILFNDNKNIFNKNGVILNKSISTTGEIHDNEGSLVTNDFEKITPNTTYSTNRIGKIAYYDKSKKYINQTTINIGKFTTPSNAFYCRFNFIISNYEEIVVCRGLTTEYAIPYDKNIIKDSYIDIFEKSNNIFNKNDLIIGYSLENGELVANESMIAIKGYINVEPNDVYFVNQTSFNMVLSYYDKSGNFVNTFSLGQQNTFTIPTNVYYFRLYTFKTKLKEVEKLIISKDKTFGLINYNRKNIKLEFENPIIRKKITKYAGLKWNSLGDSITKMDDYINGYQTNVMQILGIPIHRNYGIGGTMLCLKDDNSNSSTAMCNRFTEMDDDADIITVMGGANDWSGGRKLDNESDRYDKHTIGGAMRTIIEGLLEKYPTKHIIWITCTPRKNGTFVNVNSLGEQVDPNGNSIRDYANKQIEVCKEYNIPCIDVFNRCGINIHNLSLFTSSNDRGEVGVPDNVHLNELAHKRIASIISEDFNRYIY